jgi:hypothetical protein
MAGVLASEQFPEAVAATFPARCNRPPLTEEDLSAILAPLGELKRVEVFGARCCLTRIARQDEKGRRRFHQWEQCFETVADSELINRCLAESAYLVTPGWLADWHAAMERLGFDQSTARALLGETARRVVLLDTEIDAPAGLRQLKSFAEFVGLPFQVIPVGLSRLRLLVTRTILQWRHEREAAALFPGQASDS